MSKFELLRSLYFHSSDLAKKQTDTRAAWEFAWQARDKARACGVVVPENFLGSGKYPRMGELDELVRKQDYKCHICCAEVGYPKAQQCDECGEFLSRLRPFLQRTGKSGIDILERNIAEWRIAQAKRDKEDIWG